MDFLLSLHKFYKNNVMWKRARHFIIGICVILIISELVLRFCLGFCDALLYQPSDKYEYVLQPNQDRKRFFAHLLVNSYSQRSEEPDSTKVKILGLGDSVLFGGSWIDHDSLATTLFSKETGMQMLNISCGSWGPNNCAAYLNEHGSFGAQAMVLVCSSHDAVDKMTFIPVVGLWPGYPKEQYKLAICEAINRYLIPEVKELIQMRQYADPDAEVVKNSKKRQVINKSRTFVTGFDELKQIADSLGIPMYIYLHAEQRELESKQFCQTGLQIKQWADSANVILIDGIKEGENMDLYHDVVHFNNKGQRHLANVLKKYIISHL